jgi:hypothetical protein
MARDATNRADHDAVNAPIAAALPEIAGELTSRFDQSFGDDLLKGVVGDPMALIREWRARAWRNARLLTAARSPAERDAIATHIERSALYDAELIRIGAWAVLAGGAGRRCPTPPRAVNVAVTPR